MDGPTRVALALPAPVERAWEVLADLEAYPQWLTGTSEVEVLERDGEGRPARTRFRVAGGPVRGAWVLLHRWEPAARRVSWTLERGDVLRSLDGSHEVAVHAGGSLVRSALAVELKVPVLAALRRRAERFVVDRQLADLRERLAQRPAGPA